MSGSSTSMMDTPLQVLLPKEYIPPSLHTLCNLKPTMFHPGDDYLCPTIILLSPRDNAERFRAKVTIKVVEAIEKADGERVQNSATFLALTMAKRRKSSIIVS